MNPAPPGVLEKYSLLLMERIDGLRSFKNLPLREKLLLKYKDSFRPLINS